VHLVGFTIEIYYDVRSYKRQTRFTGDENFQLMLRGDKFCVCTQNYFEK